MKGKVEGSPSEIAELVQNRVRETAERHPQAEEREILAIDAYEVWFSKVPV
jgi:hypothetical protein